VAKELARELINAGVHFGHTVSRWNPKMAPFIFAKRGKIHIIDVKKTLAGLLIAKKLVADIVSGGKDAVFVGTKRQAQKSAESAAKKCGMHFICQRWLGGMLTNFRTIRSRLQRLEQLEAMAEDGTIESESKKHASRLKRQMRKIKVNLDGVRKMAQLPGVVIAVDAKKEYLALREAKKLGIATIGIIDTDSNPDTVDVAIPANDDSIRAIDLILNELADAVSIGKTMSASQAQPTQRPKRVRSRRSLARATAEASEEGSAGAEENQTAATAVTPPQADTQTEPSEPQTTKQPPVENSQAEQSQSPPAS